MSAAARFVLACFVGGFMAAALIETAAFTLAFWLEPSTQVSDVLDVWPFIVGTSVLVGLAAMAGFTPEDFG